MSLFDGIICGLKILGVMMSLFDVIICGLKTLGVMMSLFFDGIIRGLKMLGAMMSLPDGIIYPWVEHVVLKVLEVLDTSVWKKYLQDLIKT